MEQSNPGISDHIKPKIFSDDELEVLASKFSLLAEPSRLKILRSLFIGEKCVKDIVMDSMQMQANVSKQLRALLKAGAVSYRAEGLHRYYFIIDPTILQICQLLCLPAKVSV